MYYFNLISYCYIKTVDPGILFNCHAYLCEHLNDKVYNIESEVVHTSYRFAHAIFQSIKIVLLLIDLSTNIILLSEFLKSMTENIHPKGHQLICVIHSLFPYKRQKEILILHYIFKESIIELCTIWRIYNDTFMLQ